MKFYRNISKHKYWQQKAIVVVTSYFISISFFRLILDIPSILQLTCKGRRTHY